MVRIRLTELTAPRDIPPGARWLALDETAGCKHAAWRVLADMLGRRPEVGLALPAFGSPDTACCEWFPHLRSLRVSQAGADLGGLRHLTKLQSLTVVAPSSLETLQGVPLTRLSVTQLGTRWNEVFALRGLMSLRVLEADSLDASGLSALQNLSVLDLCKLTLKSGDPLEELPALRSLELNGVRCRVWEWISRLRELRSLGLCRLQNLAALPPLPRSLYQLMLGELPLIVEIDEIAQLPSLRTLELLTMKRITPEYFAALASHLSLEEFSYITDSQRKHALITQILNLPAANPVDPDECPLPFPADWPAYRAVQPTRSNLELPLFDSTDEIFATDRPT